MTDDKEHKVVLTERQIPQVKSPALWLGLLCVPLVLGLVIGLGKGEEAMQPQVRPPAQEIPISNSRGGVITADNAIISPEVHAKPEGGKGHEGLQKSECDFSQWEGQKISQQMVDVIKGVQKRPYRILPPGSAMTMDHSPNRVNFDINDAGIISRVWCG